MPRGSGPLSSVTPRVGADSEKRRIEQLGALVDHCTAAQTIADAQGDKFLSYMLAMTLQAARGAMRPQG